MLNKIFLIFTFLIPFSFALNPAPGIDLPLIRVLAILIFLYWLGRGLKNHSLSLPVGISAFLLCSFIFWNGFSLFFAENISWSLRKLLFLLSFFPLYLVARDLGKNSDWQKKFMLALVGGAGVSALIGIFQFSLQFLIGLEKTLALWGKIAVFFLGESFSQAVLEHSSWLVNISGTTLMRAVSFFPDPHIFSLYLGIALPIALALYWEARKNKESRKQKWLLFFSLIILLADLLTFSRGGYLALFAGLSALLLIAHQTRKIKIRLMGATAILLVFLFFSPLTPVGQRLFSSFSATDGSNQGRLTMWQTAFTAWKEHPLFGVGLGNYPLIVKPSTDYREPIYAHNLYLDIAVETGIFSLASWILLLFWALKKFWKKLGVSYIFAGGLVGLVIFSVHSLFETPIFSVHLLPLILILLALADQKNESPDEN